jgi:endonuclease YncB( thermonuclease family)
VYAQVTEVHDGDTIWVRIDGDSFKVRYIGMNAPEIGDNLQPFGNEATDYNRQLVENQTVYLVQDVSDTDQYGRLLRYVFVGDTFVNAELVRVGLARAKNYPPDTLYSDFLFEMQSAAKAARLNIWSQ